MIENFGSFFGGGVEVSIVCVPVSVKGDDCDDSCANSNINSSPDVQIVCAVAVFLFRIIGTCILGGPCRVLLLYTQGFPLGCITH